MACVIFADNLSIHSILCRRSRHLSVAINWKKYSVGHSPTPKTINQMISKNILGGDSLSWM